MESSPATTTPVLILDYGSQNTHLITRRVRSLSVLFLCISGTSPLSAIASLNPRAIILSGGPSSVYSPFDAPSFPDGFIEYGEEKGVFVLGICYGMQLLVHKLGGVVRAGEKGKEYGNKEIEVMGKSLLYGENGGREKVWMSYGDEVVRLPEGFEVVARSVETGTVAAVEDITRRLFGLQYHPEVTHSPDGMKKLERFLFEICGIERGRWKMEDTVGDDDHVICALSGGVDWTVAATLVHKVIGKRLHCVFVDNGLLRHEEKERVMEIFNNHLHLPVTCIDASEQFLDKLRYGEEKRKIIGKESISVFDSFAQELEYKLGKRPAYLVQGTLYPDVIESCPPPGCGRNHSHTIKSHHNVGGLPKDMKLKLIEPLKLLFKDKADEIFIKAIEEEGLYDTIWQAGVMLPNSKTVGVQGDQRSEGNPAILRAVTSEDGMTADWHWFDIKFLDEVSVKITNNVRGVNRVPMDITSKPPATIEWQ
ncbi:GMP synthase [glutamine-hydrolyzing]-like protein [Drosera capensis]